MADRQFKNPIAVETLTPTPQTSSSFTVSGTVARRSGNIVILETHIELTNAMSGWEVAVSGLPASAWFEMTFPSRNGSVILRGSMDSQGNFKIVGGEAGKTYDIRYVYFPNS